MKSIFDVQPSWCREKLPEKEINLEGYKQPYIDKLRGIVLYDPTDFYNKHHQLIDPYKRNNVLSIWKIYPAIENVCACGCNNTLTGREKKWSKGHNELIYTVTMIISGSTQHALKPLLAYHGTACQHCNTPDIPLQVDHKIPVKHGGGGCWLSNYQLLCHTCHRNKTNLDFGWKNSRQHKLV